MPYPEKVLAEDEEVVKRLHPHWITLVVPTLWFLVICAALGVTIAFLPSGTTGEVLLIIVIVLALVLASWLCFIPALHWRTTHYVLTTHRVLIRRGILHHTGRDISLQRINDVGFSQTLWDRIVKAGSLTIESAGEHGQETLINIPRSDEIQQLLNQLIEQDHDRRARVAFGGSPYGPTGPAGSGYPPSGYPQQSYPPPQGCPPYQGSPQPQSGYAPPGYPDQPGYGTQGYPPTQPYPPQH
ncbi:MAG: PH domain-containing protein [Actinobacteria bacterium]|nr:PH domain-containing protein [Actinomycetota bacterium]